MNLKTQSLPASLQNASDLLARNDAAGAERALRRVIKSDGDNAVAFHLLGIAIAQQGRIDEGAEMIRKSLRMRPTDANLRTNFGIILQNHGRRDQAITEFRRAIELNPRQAEAYANLGKLLLGKREYLEAQRVLQRGADVDPARPDVLNDLGVSLLQQSKLEEAQAAFRRAIELAPKFAVAHNNLGGVLREMGDLPAAEREMRLCLALDPRYVRGYENLGRLLLDLKRCEEAEKVMRQALEIAPNAYEIHRGLGNVLHDLNRLDEALAELAIANRLRPDNRQVLVDLAHVYNDTDRMQEAADVLQRALELDPDSPEVHSGIGYNYYLRGMVRESLAANEEVVRLDPRNIEVRVAQAVNLLLLGDLERGWEAYEWRHRFKDQINIPVRGSAPRWDGSSPNGRTILLHWEQGFGDSIQFCRYAPLVAKMGARVIVEVQGSLVRLLQSLEGVEQVISHGQELPPFDISCSMMSLPYVLKTRLDSIPNRVPYLRALPEDVAAWQARLGEHRRLRVALAWSGLGQHGLNRRRSMKLDTLAPILAVPEVEFFSLQMGGAEEIMRVAPGNIIDVTPHIRDFADTAAALMQMDLVICVDTAIAHLAGALNVPVWMMLYLPSEWRWMLNRNDSPWYPSMRIFRQREVLAWEPVVQAVAAELRPRAAQFRSEPARGEGNT